MRGAREALGHLRKEAGKALDLHFVWTRVLPADDRAQAALRAEQLAGAGVRHYWDAAQLVGRYFKPALEVGDSPLAWDVYLLFRPGTTWSEKAPVPAAWAHQLRGADPARFFGGRLGERLQSEYRALRGLPTTNVPPKPVRETLTIDPGKLKTVPTLILEDVLAELRAELPESERAAFDQTAARIRERYEAREKASGIRIPKGLRLRGSIVAVPEPSCAPSPTDGKD